MYYNQKKDKIGRGLKFIELFVAIISVGIIAGLAGCGKNECKESCIQEKIEAGKKELISLNDKRNNELQPIYDKHFSEKQKYHRDLRYNLRSLGINKHEEFARRCEQNKHIETCNLLERTAVLQHSLKFVGEKIAKVNTKIAKIEQIVWLLEKKLELGQIIDSHEEEKKVNEIIASTKEILEEKITPPEAQDIGQYEQKIFNEIMHGR